MEKERKFKDGNYLTFHSAMTLHKKKMNKINRLIIIFIVFISFFILLILGIKFNWFKKLKEVILSTTILNKVEENYVSANSEPSSNDNIDGDKLGDRDKNTKPIEENQNDGNTENVSDFKENEDKAHNKDKKDNDKIDHQIKDEDIDKEDKNQKEKDKKSKNNNNKNKDRNRTQKDNSTKDKKKPNKKKTNYKEKVVYLTFDDGPSKNTELILNILDEYNVKATFFVVGREDDFSKEMYREIVKRGHTLGMHSYSHKYKEIYRSLKSFKKDFRRISNLLFETTGVIPNIYRFPGGSMNGVSKTDMRVFIKYLNNKNIVYYDWNVLNGDAEPINYTKKQLIHNVMEGIESRNTSIVLMHDNQDKINTVKTLPKILDQLVEKGVKILPLDVDAPKIQMIPFDSVE